MCDETGAQERNGGNGVRDGVGFQINTPWILYLYNLQMHGFFGIGCVCEMCGAGVQGAEWGGCDAGAGVTVRQDFLG